MSQSFSQLYDNAVTLLHELCTDNGILASTIEADNYKRIWARDSVICGIAGLKIGDKTITEGLKKSLITLANHQNSMGMIPSNVLPNNKDVSFGSLVGRIDAHTWFILGSCLYYLNTKDTETWEVLKPKVSLCRSFLKALEFNNKDWLYTPLSGNWADEYPIHGYTLYDNMLRIWGETCWNEIEGIDTIVDERFFQNFWPCVGIDEAYIYQKSAFQKLNLDAISHYIAFILPGKYDTRFDAAGNALALLQKELSVDQKEKLSQYIETLETDIGKGLIPAFWPMINAQSEDWNLLEGNFSYNFKNHPGAFHNGGIWPVWMGLFTLGLAKNNMLEEAKKIIHVFTETVNQDSNWNFQEYLHAKTFRYEGKTKMGYTASGIVFMKLALELDI